MHCCTESFVGVVQTIALAISTAAKISASLVKAFGFGVWLANGPAHDAMYSVSHVVQLFPSSVYLCILRTVL